PSGSGGPEHEVSLDRLEALRIALGLVADDRPAELRDRERPRRQRGGAVGPDGVDDAADASGRRLLEAEAEGEAVAKIGDGVRGGRRVRANPCRGKALRYVRIERREALGKPLHVKSDDQIDDGIVLRLDTAGLELDPALRWDSTDQVFVDLAVPAVVRRDAPPEGDERERHARRVPRGRDRTGEPLV